MKISYGITVHNETDELNKLLEILIHKTDPEDEIVICDDYSDEKTQEVITSWIQQYSHEKTIKVYQRKLDGDFSAQ
ncbi:glycosyltransferase, partial [Candidatus Woesearchaeota archaeon]|nr:glycosyltransferase [Candidatus Woesearchaeota archaeon]